MEPVPPPREEVRFFKLTEDIYLRVYRSIKSTLSVILSRNLRSAIQMLDRQCYISPYLTTSEALGTQS